MTVLASEHFVHALQREAGSSTGPQAIELESFLYTRGGEGEATIPRQDFRARKNQVDTAAATGVERTRGRDFIGSCWVCGEMGLMRSRCSRNEERAPSIGFPFITLNPAVGVVAC